MTAPHEERIRRGRPPWWLVGVFVAVAAAVVAGLAATGYRGERSAASTTTTRPPDVATLVARSDLLLIGDVATVRRLGDPRDPAVVATLTVERVLTSGPSPAEPLTVYDKGFKESWRQGQRVLLSLGRARGAAASQARWQVQQRYRFEGSRLLAPFRVADVLAAAARS